MTDTITSSIVMGKMVSMSYWQVILKPAIGLMCDKPGPAVKVAMKFLSFDVLPALLLAVHDMDGSEWHDRHAGSQVAFI